MYEELNYNIETCAYDDDVSENTWSDNVCDYTCEYLLKFKQEDWEKLLKDLPSKSTMWKKRFIDCLGDVENKNELKALLIMANTDDLELFTFAISNLSAYDLDDVQDIDYLFEKAEKMMPEIEDYYKPYFAQFLEKKKTVSK